MKRLAILAFAMSVMAVLLTGCHTSKKVTTTDSPGSPNSEVVAVDSYGYLSRRLGISIGKHDKENLELFTVAEKWLGVPYRYGGNTKKVAIARALCRRYIRQSMANRWNVIQRRYATRIAVKSDVAN